MDKHSSLLYGHVNDEVKKFYDIETWFVANIGGILGLTMGCSLVTIFEILHHVTICFVRDQFYQNFFLNNFPLAPSSLLPPPS
jgi:hypothetical protein